MVDIQNDKFGPWNRTVIMELIALTRLILRCIQSNCRASKLKDNWSSFYFCFSLVCFETSLTCAFSMMTNVDQPSNVLLLQTLEIIHTKFQHRLCIKACNFKLQISSFTAKTEFKLQKHIFWTWTVVGLTCNSLWSETKEKMFSNF